MIDFFKTFIISHQEEFEIFQKKFKNPKNKVSMHPSILLTSLMGIYNYFQGYINNIKVLMDKINNELINPLNEFSSEQLKIYDENIKKIKDINSKYKDYNNLLEYSKNNYYKISYKVKNSELDLIKNPILKADNNKNKKDTLDILLKEKMMAKNAELNYKYDIIKYNQNIQSINKNYNEIIDKIKLAEKSRIYFIKASVNKYRNFINQYNKYTTEFINILQTYVNDDVCQKDEKYFMQEISKFVNNQNNNRIPLEKFISFNEYYEKNKEKINKKSFEYELNDENKKKILSNEKDINNFIKDLLKKLTGEDEVKQEQMANIFILLRNKKLNIESKFIDCLLNLKTQTTLEFSNLKNLNHLSNIINYITLNNSSFSEKNFELNFKIIFLSEKIFYKNKMNNNKVYLSATLSKNKYYRTKLFWRNIMELKLAHKLEDHIERLKKLPEEKKKGLFSKIGSAMGFSNTLHKNSLLSKSRILPLIKDYNEIDESKVEIVDKMMIQEMQIIIKENIPYLFKFNFSGNDVLDFLANLSEEYKIPNDQFKFFVIYSNVSSYTIMKQLPEDESYHNFNIINFKKKDELNRKIKYIHYTIPYLQNSDFINLLLCSKQFNIKLRKKIYSYVLKQNNVDTKIRLKIWENILGIKAIKKKFDYRVVLCNAHNPKIKSQIELDMIRTVSSDNEAKNKIINLLYAVSEVNGETQYCQGMNYIGQFLYEAFGEEEAFYIFLGIFFGTEYSIIMGKDLKKLNIFFYIFKRILSLLEPELNSHFNSSGVEVNSFLPQWFITLFTGSHHYIKSNENNTKIILRILDSFILFGWKSMIAIGCAALHSFENTLIKMNYDDMMQFLINDILKSDFFSCKNEENIKKVLDDINISKKLIKNIEDEFLLENNLRRRSV